MRPKARQAYRGTQVPAYRSQQQIEDLLLKYGAQEVHWSRIIKVDRRAIATRFKRGGRMYRFVMELGEDQRDEWQRMRALHYCLKAMFEQLDFEILRFDDLFLAYAEILLPGGDTVTVADVIQEQVGRFEVPSLEAGLRLLPAPRKD